MISQIALDCQVCNSKNNCVYPSLKKDERELLNNGKILKKIKKNDTLYKEGYPATACFLIVEGAVKLSRKTHLEAPYFLLLRNAGSLIGFESLNNKTGSIAYECTAHSITETLCCIIPSGLIYTLIRNSKETCMYLSSQYNNFISGLYTHATLLGTTNSEARIAKSLLILMGISKEKIIDIRIDDLASISGAARETTSRVLSKMKADKLISISNRIIHINDEQKLREIL